VKMVMPVETNLVIFELKEGEDPRRFVMQMKENNILLLPITESRLRIVTHLDIDDTMVEKFIRVLNQIH